MKNLFILSLVFIIILFSGCLSNQEPRACTMEAKLCPDGSYVGRTGPDCEFTPCPIFNQSIWMTYQPMQCQETPWETWYKEGHIQYIMAPTDEQLIVAYFSWNNISISSAKRIQTNNMVCQACYSCPTTYYYNVMIKEKYREMLAKVGFTS